MSAVEARTTARPLRRFTYVAGVLLIVAAIVWPLAEPFKGPVLWDFGEHHGLDVGDLVAVPVFVLGVALLWQARRARRPPRG